MQPFLTNTNINLAQPEFKLDMNFGLQHPYTDLGMPRPMDTW